MAEKKKSFEENMSRLEEIVQRLERGDAPLEESLKLFEEGTGLMRQCSTLLEKAEQKVVKLTATSDGTLTAQPFQGEEL